MKPAHGSACQPGAKLSRTGRLQQAPTDPCDWLQHPATDPSVAAGTQQIVNLVLESVDPMFGLLPCGRTIVAVILIRIESQQSDEKDRHDNDNRGAHVFGCTLFAARDTARRPLLEKAATGLAGDVMAMAA